MGDALVSVSLNGQQFSPSNAAPFTFVGVTAPRITGALFTNAGTEIVVSFDAQPTDRGGMRAIGPCVTLFDDASVALLRGGYATEPLCYWLSDTELRAQLNVASTIRPGDALVLRAGVIRPLVFALGGGTCAAAPGKCASGGLAIDADRPCAACDLPTAAITAPTRISTCPGQRLRLDGSASRGVGPVPLVFEWRVDATRSDHSAELNALLAARPPNSPVVELGGLTAPLQGERYVFLLRTTSLFGDQSAVAEWAVRRAGGASPSVAIDGPFALVHRSGAALQLLGVAQLASCYPPTDSPAILFRWAVLATRETASGAPAPGAPPSLGPLADKAHLLVPPGTFVAGRTYTLQLRAEMETDPPSVGDATIEVAVVALPLRLVLAGGDRRASTLDAVAIDASASLDPNAAEPHAGLRFAWTVADENGTAVALPAVRTDRATLELPAGALAAGSYRVALELGKPPLASVRSSLALELTAALVPQIAFDTLSAAKYNPVWSKPAERFALATSLDAAARAAEAAGGVRYSYAWTALIATDDSGTQLVDAGLDLADVDAVTTTGAAQPTLAFRSGVLQPNALYSFRLEVAGGAALATAEARVRMNRPPFGGELVVSPSRGRALATTFTLAANGWNDDTDDLPLTYTFAHQPAAGSPGFVLATRQRSSVARAVLDEGLGGVVRVTVYDFFDGAVDATADVDVEPPPCDALGAALARGADVAVLTGDPFGALQQLRVLARARPECLPGGANASAPNATAEPEYAPDDLAASLLALARAAADASGASSASSRSQYAGVLAAVLEGSALSAAAQARGLELVAALAASTAAAGADGATADALVAALDAVLGAPAAGLTAAQAALVQASAVVTAEGVGAALLAGTVRGELVATLGAPNVNISAERQTASRLANGARAGPGGVGAVALPPAAFEAMGAGATAHGVDLLLVNYGSPVHADPSAQLPPGQRAGAALASRTTFGIVLRSPALRGARLRVEGLATPILLTLALDAPLARTTEHSNRTFNCTADAQCDAFGAGAGACGADGACACAFTFSGERCGVRTLCRFWDEAASVWSTEGCVTLPPPAGAANDTLHCSCDHLTDFAGVSLPTTRDEFERDASAVRLNTFSAAELGRAVDLSQPVPLAANRSVYTLVFALAAACVASLALASGRDRYQKYAHAREMESLRAQLGRASPARKKGWRPTTRRQLAARQRQSRVRSIAEYLDETIVGLEAQLALARETAARTLQGRQLLRTARREAAEAIASAAAGDAAAREAARERLVATTERVRRVADPEQGAADALAAAENGDGPGAAPGGEPLRQRRLAKLLTSMLRQLRSEHSVLAIFARDRELPRAVHVQIVFNLLMLEVMIACLLLDPDDTDGAINLVTLAVNSTITAALCAPCLVAIKLVWAWAFALPLPLLSRLAAAVRRQLASRDTLKARRRRMVRQTFQTPPGSPRGSALGSPSRVGSRLASPRGSPAAASASPAGSPRPSPTSSPRRSPAHSPRSERSALGGGGALSTAQRRSPSPSIRGYKRTWAAELCRGVDDQLARGGTRAAERRGGVDDDRGGCGGQGGRPQPEAAAQGGAPEAQRGRLPPPAWSAREADGRRSRPAPLELPPPAAGVAVVAVVPRKPPSPGTLDAPAPAPASPPSSPPRRPSPPSEARRAAGPSPPSSRLDHDSGRPFPSRTRPQPPPHPDCLPLLPISSPR